LAQTERAAMSVIQAKSGSNQMNGRGYLGSLLIGVKTARRKAARTRQRVHALRAVAPTGFKFVMSMVGND